MKRSWLKRKKGYKGLRKVSSRQRQINKCYAELRVILKLERGYRCELCGRPEEQLPYPLSLFHILARSEAPKLILHHRNILLACFVPYEHNKSFCHNKWHKLDRDHPKYIEIRERVKELRGEDFRAELMGLNYIASPLTMTSINMTLECLKAQRKELERGT